jgi:hypothetical protein
MSREIEKACLMFGLSEIRRHPHDCGGIASVQQKKSAVDGCAPHLDESTSVGS